MAATGERGYMLLVIMLGMAMLLFALAATAPSIAQQIKREREEELIRRGTQYARAIQRFYRKFGRYPGRLEELEGTNNQRFVRRRFKDPMTEDGEWRLIRLGEAKATPQGAFGAGQPGTGQPKPASGGTAGSSGTSGAKPEGPAPVPVSQLAGSQKDGPKFGGAPIVGVASRSVESAIKEWNGKTHYNEWEFVYDFSMDTGIRQGQPPGAPGQPGKTPQPPAKPTN